ncbi:rhamnogalacturonan acetylesterase [Roseimarinus sediminis]|uniref:rhamnogalacturonan acetylesterase n=1 Tax=Roseimarinus sediminis TaxID=1610899 RepID=UPI003D1FFD23
MHLNFVKAILLFFLAGLFISCQQEEQTPTLFMIGDSTMASKPDLTFPERGWGQLLPQYFEEDLLIDNHAKNGRSTRSFIYESRWDTVHSKIQAGDFVVIQFGHNDGVESKIGRHAAPEEYRYNLIKFIRETRAKGAEPLLCTPIVRRFFNEEGAFEDTHGEYPAIVREVAAEHEVTLIDLHRKSEALLSRLGVEASIPLFLHFEAAVYPQAPDGKIDNTHFSEKGALTMAGMFVEGLKEQNHPLVNYLK